MGFWMDTFLGVRTSTEWKDGPLFIDQTFLLLGSIQCFAKGATLGFGQALGRKMLDGRVSDSTAETLSGGIGGGFQGFVMSPILLLKTRVITGWFKSIMFSVLNHKIHYYDVDPRFRGTGGTWQTTVAATKLGVEIVKSEGMMVLMKGAGTFTVKRIADWTTRFFFAEQVMQCFNENARTLN